MEEISRSIKDMALKAGFHLVGITSTRQPDKIKFLDEWLAAGYYGSMKWMHQHLALRRDVRLLFPGAKSIICVGHNYYVQEEQETDKKEARISHYARGKDYHRVMKKKLKSLLSEIKKVYPGMEGRICVDTAPVMEKIWAEAAGLGWQGKHTILISREIGSWFFLGEIIVNVELAGDQPLHDQCGECEACLTACPTRAIVKPYILDASRCISYLTIEYQPDLLPSELARKMDNWIFGCDICQQVCPWNKFKKSTDEKEYLPFIQSGDSTFTRLLNLNESQFKQTFRSSPILRTGYKNFIRNVQNANENKKIYPGGKISRQ